ncbi:MAG: hypothetical protein A3D17_03395 [Bdellovibrionales bacterium RIFCSPHIGHO2_02_FULL_40_15]|nr:MAG: hypothetical protein A3D17_03395 [Bdellovibrionales bacterium RIFCSPHIGHO2_02_FULL_40_15]
MKKFLSTILFFSILPLTSFSAVTRWTSSLPEKSKFTATDELADRVEFWRKIFSEYTTHQGVFHMIDDPDFVLGEVDLTSIYQNSVLNDSMKGKLIKAEINKSRKAIAKKWKISEVSKIRLQMGLKDRMQKALFLSGRYLPMMEAIFKRHGIPIELTRIVFVESSFNILAQSKVGASGIWQIMPSVAKPEGYITANYDKRNHPVYATELAARILKQNYRKLGSWPLAITAYNHGLTGIKRMKVKAKSDQLEDLIESEERTKTWGFASKNFYACFLAALEVERRAPELFGQNLLKSVALNTKEYKLRRTMPKSKLLPWYNGSITLFKRMNPHLNWNKISKNQKIPAGVPLQVPIQNYHLAIN